MSEKKRRIYRDPCKSCDNCGKLMDIGEGSYVCGDDTSKVVIDSYVPADDNFCCHGWNWVRG